MYVHRRSVVALWTVPSRRIAGLAAMLAVWLSAGCAGPTTRAPEPPVSAATLLEQAQKLLPRDLAAARAKWRQARELLEKAIATNPNDRDAIYELGIVYEHEANAVVDIDAALALTLADTAEGFDLRAFALEPNNAGPLNTAGLLFDGLADRLAKRNLTVARELWKRARANYQRALDLLPKQPGAANNMGSSFFSESQALQSTDLVETERLWKLAAEYFGRALVIQPDKANAESNWGQLLSHQAEYYATTDLDRAFPLWVEAAKKFERAIKDDARFADAYSAWGSAEETYAWYLADRDLGSARELWHHSVGLLRRAQQLAPGLNPALSDIAVARVHEAISIAKIDPDAARDLLDSGVGTAQLATQSEEDRENAFRVLGWSLAQKAAMLAPTDRVSARRYWTEADAAFQRSLDTRPTELAAQKWAEVLHDEAELVGRTDPGSAAPLWQACIDKCAFAARLAPQWSPPHNLWGDALYTQAVQLSFIDTGREQALLEEACGQFAASVKIAPLSQTSQLLFGMAEYELGRLVWGNAPQRSLELWHAADENYQAVLGHDSQRINVRGLHITALETLGEAYLRSDPERGRAYLLQAILFGRETFRKYEPDSASTRFLAKSLDILASARALNAEALWDEASEYLRRATAKSPGDADLELEWASDLAHHSVYVMAADPARADKLWNEAETHFSRAAALDTTSPIVYGQWGHELLNKGDYAKGLNQANAIKFWLESTARCREAVRRSPANAVGAINLAVSLIRQFVELGSTQTNLLDEAQAALLQAHPERDGLASYNLACIAALRHDPMQCVNWLIQSSATGGRPGRSEVDVNPYLASVKDTTVYKNWYATTFPESTASETGQPASPANTK